DALHGDLSQQQRDKVMKRYRERSLQLLIATDVAARGIDVNDVTHVINYSLPDEIENYTHRSGRTARAGKTGISLSLVNLKELGKIRQIEKVIGKSFVKMEVPRGEAVVESQLFAMIHKVQQVSVNDDHIDPYLPKILESFADLSKEEIIKRFASLEFNRFLEYYQNAPDLNVDANEGRNSFDRERKGKGERFGRDGYRSDYTRLFINLGSVDEFTRGDILGYICNTTHISGKSIGKIDLKGVYTFFEVENAAVDKVFSGFQQIDFNGRTVRVENAGDSVRSERRGSDRPYRNGNSNPRKRRDHNDGGGFRNFSSKRREKSRW